MLVALVMGSGAALAQQPIEHVSGRTELQPCLDEVACEGVLVELASETLVDFGFFLQHDPLAGSALIGRGTGFVFELHADTYKLGSRNLVTEEFVLPPLLPKLEVGYQLGSFTFDDPYPQFAITAFLFPPLSAQGYKLVNTGATASAAVPVYLHHLWVGGELGMTYGNVGGEMIGDGSVIRDLDSVAPFVDFPDPPCADTTAGCRDRIRQVVYTGRVGVTVEPLPAVFAYSKVGITHMTSDLFVAYDDSQWRLKGLQPSFSYGVGVRLADRVMLAAGGITALRSAEITSNDARTLTRLNFGISVRTGDARYWYEDAPPEGPAGVKPAG